MDIEKSRAIIICYGGTLAASYGRIFKVKDMNLYTIISTAEFLIIRF